MKSPCHQPRTNTICCRQPLDQKANDPVIALRQENPSIHESNYAAFWLLAQLKHVTNDNLMLQAPI